jgi:hypothetical protein
MTDVGSCSHREDLGVFLDHIERYLMTFNVFLVLIPKLDFTGCKRNHNTSIDVFCFITFSPPTLLEQHYRSNTC